MKRWIAISLLMAAASLIPNSADAQRGMRMGGGGGVRSAGAPVRMSAAPSPHMGAPVNSVARPGFVPINPGFVGHGGVPFRGGIPFRGTVGFGHNPRFFVRSGHGFRNPCFRTGFCGGFGGSTFFNGGIPVVAYYPYTYAADYGQYYSGNEQTSPYTVAQGENQNAAAAYEQGAMAQQVAELTSEVERLRAEVDARDRERARASAPTVQELPLNATLVLRDGRRMQIHNYAIVGQTIWLFDEKLAKKMALAQLDLNATKRVNEENGVLFLLPGMK